MSRTNKSGVYLQVLQEVAEHVPQLFDEELSRLLPPPIPKDDTSFCIFPPPHFMQETFFSPPIEMRSSNCFPQLLHLNSYIGMTINYTSSVSQKKVGNFAWMHFHFRDLYGVGMNCHMNSTSLSLLAKTHPPTTIGFERTRTALC